MTLILCSPYHAAKYYSRQRDWREEKYGGRFDNNCVVVVREWTSEHNVLVYDDVGP